MDKLPSLLLAAGVIMTALAVLGLWTWRRSTRGIEPVETDEKPGAKSRLTIKVTAAAISDEVLDATDFPDVGSGPPKDGPPDDSAVKAASSADADAPAGFPESTLTVPQQPNEVNSVQGLVGESSTSDAPASPVQSVTPRPAIAGASLDERPGDWPPYSSCTVAEVKKEEKPADRDDQVFVPPESSASTAQSEQDEPYAPTVAIGSPTSSTVDQAKAQAAGRSAAIEGVSVALSGPASASEPGLPSDLTTADGALNKDELDGEQEPETATGGSAGKEFSTGPTVAETASGAGPSAAGEPQLYRPSQPAVHRDRRGKRRATAPTIVPPFIAAPRSLPPAEARLRLSLHPIHRTAGLSLVLMRPEGFPERVTLDIDGQTPIEAYNSQRYDDLDLPWTGELLTGELRINSAERLQWLRSARRVHIFTEDPSEPGMISVGAARAGAAHAVICRSDDASAVCAAAESAGSAKLTAHEHWQGIPDGWAVLSGYRPTHSAAPLETGLRPLDPGTGVEIVFDGGLAIRLKVFAEGHPPRISIGPLPEDASVTISGQPAALGAGGGWEAPGWDAPGRHMVDIVPGPSATYEIVADPAVAGGWKFWDAHAGRFGKATAEPWARAEICGASVRGPAGQAVFAVESQPILIALGARSGAVTLLRRTDVSVSVGFVPEPPAFLLSSTGQRRCQGRVIWLGLAPPAQISKRYDPVWAAAVRTAASRHLMLEGASTLGEDAWQKAKEQARQLRRPRR